MTDPISDMLTRIRNGQAVAKKEIILPFSKIKYEIGKLLVREGFLESAEKISETKFNQIKLVLKYDENDKPAVEHIKRVSKPGQRIYVSQGDIPKILNGLGLAVLSTSQGIITNKKARRMKIGGELLFEIW